MARLLTLNDEMICHLEGLHIGGEPGEGTPFSAVVSDDAALIRQGPVMLEADDGSSWPGEIDHAEAISDPLGVVVRITGVLRVGRSG